jgi:ubiquinone/menaquinone biosynthesis C-methylase UbiE
MSTPAPAQGSPQPAAPQPAERLMQFATGYMVSSALYGVTSLGIPDLLKSGSKSVDELALLTGSHEGALYRVMRALASIGLFAENPTRTFSLTPVSEPLCQDVPNSMRDMALWIADPFHFEVYGELSHSLRTGETVPEKIYGLPCFEYLAQDQEVGDRFNNAMTGFSATVIAAALEAYDFSCLSGKTLVDVAGGHGKVLTEILKKYPDVRGVLFDLEHVVQGARPRLQSEGLSTRCSIAHGDFFQTVPSGDAYIMKHIIHDWDDAHALTILKNIHAAASPGARLYLLEAVISLGNEPHLAKFIDIEMLVLPGGCERTEKEYRDLLSQAGFQLTKVVKTKSPLDLIEAIRKD